jgi:proteasome lid subunit RPN8/RPN11
MLIIEPKIRQLIFEDAQQAFPDECCGFLFGDEQGETRILKDILIVENAKMGDKRRRFEISPKDYLRAERYALEHDLTLLSVYHSHPSAPAIPSETDRLAAQPYFSYVIVSIYERGRTELLSWRLNDDFQFEPEQVLEHAFN